MKKEIIECPVCKNKIAYDAFECPHCGHVIRKRRRSSGTGVFLTVLGPIVVVSSHVLNVPWFVTMIIGFIMFTCGCRKFDPEEPRGDE